MPLTTEDLYKGALRSAAEKHLSPEAADCLEFGSGLTSAQTAVGGLKITVALPDETNELMDLVADFVNGRPDTRVAPREEKTPKSASKTASKSKTDPAKDATRDEPAAEQAKTESAAQSVARAKKNSEPKIPVDPNDDF